MKMMFAKLSTIFLVVALLFVVAPPALAKIPALDDVPVYLPPQQQAEFNERSRKLEQKIATFQADGEAFNKLDAKDQTDAEFNSLQQMQAECVAAVHAFNADLDQAHHAQITKTMLADREAHSVEMQRYKSDIDDLSVSAPSKPLIIHEGIILGLNDPRNKVEEKYRGITSPFSGKEIAANNIFATTDSDNGSAELLRGLKDNLSMAAYTLNTDAGKELVAKLKGASFDRLLAHSNGATIAEALIRSDVIHVDELNVVGGDRSLSNAAGLQELIDTGKVKRIVVWINPGDPVPSGSAAPQLALITSPVGNAQVGTMARYFSDILLEGKKGGDAKVEYRYLSGNNYTPKSQEFHLDERAFDAHDLNAYLPNMKASFDGNP